MESPIDEKYRLLLLEHCLENAQEVMGPGGSSKWQFVCPFCGPLGRTEGKKRHRKAALLWKPRSTPGSSIAPGRGVWSVWGGKTFGNLISALNPALGEAYKKDRWHSGTVGKGHNCGVPQRLVGITTG